MSCINTVVTVEVSKSILFGLMYYTMFITVKLDLWIHIQ